MNDTLGIIGSANIGGAVARLAVNAGIDVVLSNSRGPETLRALTARLGPRARAATAAEAAAAGDWTVVAVPFIAVPHLPVDALAGKTVIDANNYYLVRRLPGPNGSDDRGDQRQGRDRVGRGHETGRYPYPGGS